MELSISCRNGRTNLVVTGQTISGRGDDYAISYRINGDKPVQVASRFTIVWDRCCVPGRHRSLVAVIP